MICFNPSNAKSAFIQQGFIPISLSSCASDAVIEGLPNFSK
jgi:hypothetical protein